MVEARRVVARVHGRALRAEHPERPAHVREQHVREVVGEAATDDDPHTRAIHAGQKWYRRDGKGSITIAGPNLHSDDEWFVHTGQVMMILTTKQIQRYYTAR